MTDHKDHVLRGPDGTVYVTGDGGEKSRLLAEGYTETDRSALREADKADKPAADKPSAAEQKAADTAARTTTRNDSK